MRKATEYRQHAKACRDLAARMDRPDKRDQLLVMAEGEGTMASDREGILPVQDHRRV